MVRTEEGKDVKAGRERERKVWIAKRRGLLCRLCPGLCKWMLVGMGWEWRSAGQSVQGCFGEGRPRLGRRTSLALALPKASRGAQLQLTMMAADCVGYVSTQPAWSPPPDLEQQTTCNSPYQRNMGPCCTRRHAQHLGSIRFRYMMPKCNSTIALQPVSTWHRSHRKQVQHVVQARQYHSLPNGLPSPQNAQSTISPDALLSWLCILGRHTSSTQYTSCISIPPPSLPGLPSSLSSHGAGPLTALFVPGSPFSADCQAPPTCRHAFRFAPGSCTVPCVLQSAAPYQHTPSRNPGFNFSISQSINQPITARPPDSFI